MNPGVPGPQFPVWGGGGRGELAIVMGYITRIAIIVVIVIRIRRITIVISAEASNSTAKIAIIPS